MHVSVEVRFALGVLRARNAMELSVFRNFISFECRATLLTLAPLSFGSACVQPHTSRSQRRACRARLARFCRLAPQLSVAPVFVLIVFSVFHSNCAHFAVHVCMCASKCVGSALSGHCRGVERHSTVRTSRACPAGGGVVPLLLSPAPNCLCSTFRVSRTTCAGFLFPCSALCAMLPLYPTLYQLPHTHLTECDPMSCCDVTKDQNAAVVFQVKQ